MCADGPEDVSIRPAEPADHLEARRVLDAALLEVAELGTRIEEGGVLVATADDRIVGVVVVEPEGPDATTVPPSWRDAAHVRSLAVRRRRRGRGIGTALVEAAAERFGTLAADFDPKVAPFYDDIAAEVRAGEGDRHWALVEEPPA